MSLLRCVTVMCLFVASTWKQFLPHDAMLARYGVAVCPSVRPSVCLSVGPIANLKGPYFHLRLSVSVCVCVCPSVCLSICLSLTGILPFNVNRFWRNLVTRTLLWSSLAATIMIQIGRRGTARRLFENFKIFSKITIRISKFWSTIFASVSPVCCKKNRLDSNKTDGGDRFWSLPLRRFRQWHCCSSTTLYGIFWLNWRRGSLQRSKLGAFRTAGIPNWGRNRAVKPTGLFIYLLHQSSTTYYRNNKNVKQT